MLINGRQFTLGADPEFFLIKKSDIKKKRQYFWCAEGLLPGTKLDPYRLKNGAVQVDGMAGEFNIDPVKTPAGFLKNIKSVLGQVNKMVDPQGYKIVATPVAEFSKEHYDSCSDESKELGCNPDFNAYTCEVNPTPTPPKDKIFRTGAGHIHIGWGEGFDKSDEEFLKGCRHLVKHLDCMVGRPLFNIDHEGYLRRKLYGGEGCFRPTPFGLEYRTPSNVWLNSPEMVTWVATQAFEAVKQTVYTPLLA